jgi:hypothetical protein
VRPDLLGLRALNRATLERQLLLRRSTLSLLEAVEHLVGLQAQVPGNPYTALWSRLEQFRPEELSSALLERKIVRIPVMRATIHLVTADDCLSVRPLMQPVLDQELSRHREFGPAVRGVDLDAVLEAARALLAERPLTGAELRDGLAERFPGHDAAALAYACRNKLALVQVPPRGLWGESAQVRSTTAEAWLGRPLAGRPSLGELVLRYLAAFGPATVADVATWSRLTGLRRIVEQLRPRLRAFRDEQGRELLDLPDAPRPDPDTPAPPRFLPEYDNVLLSHADRGRFVSVEDRARLGRAGGLGSGSVLVDGRVWGVWRVGRGTSEEAVLVVSHLARAPRRTLAAVAAEGRRLLRLLEPGAAVRDVRFVAIE